MKRVSGIMKRFKGIKRTAVNERPKIAMKGSIRRQIMAIFIILVGALLLATLAINAFFLETFYIRNKRAKLHDIYNSMNDAAGRGELTADETVNELSRMVEVGNVSFVVITDNNQKILSAAPSDAKSRELLNQLMGYIFGQHKTDGEILESGDNYRIHMAKDSVSAEEYIEMWGYLDGGNAFILRTSLESIRESVGLSNRFFILTAIVMACLGSVAIWYFARRITNPIMELSSLSARMADLDFEARYSGNEKNEIGVLGNNFNIMSGRLRDTVSQLKNANYELQKDIENKEKMETMRTEFIGNVSHELKTPIALIQGYAEGLRDGISESPEDRAFYCDVILDEANKMNQLVKNLLTLNQLELGDDDIAFERFNLTDMIKGILHGSKILIDRKGIKVNLHAKEQVFVWADEFRTEQVIRNYLSNAVNHADGEKIIDIRVAKDTERGKARVSIFNTGSQIPEEEKERIWDKFYKADKARTREYGGHGIGLSIVKAIMTSFHQEYGVTNYENGVAFWFELDLK